MFGYLTMDLVELLHHWKTTADAPTFLLHHLGGMIAFAPTLIYKKFLQIVMLIVTTESSTPFVNLRWLLSILGLDKQSRLYIANGLLMMLVFAVMRVILVPLVIYKLWKRDYATFEKEQLTAQVLYYVTVIGMWIMNTRWFSMMISALMSLVTGK